MRPDDLVAERWIKRLTDLRVVAGWLIEHADDFYYKSQRLREVINGQLVDFDLGEYMANLVECDTNDELTVYTNRQYVARHIDGLSEPEVLELINRLDLSTLKLIQSLIKNHLGAGV